MVKVRVDALTIREKVEEEFAKGETEVEVNFGRYVDGLVIRKYVEMFNLLGYKVRDVDERKLKFVVTK